VIRKAKRFWKGILVFLAVFIVSQMFRVPSAGGPIVEFAYKLRDLLASAMIGLGVDLLAIRGQIRLLMNNRQKTPNSLRGVLTPLIQRELHNLNDDCTQLTTRIGAVISLDALRELIAGAYLTHAEGHCVVLHELLPSEYAFLFPTYRDQHFSSARSIKPGRDVRVLACSVEKLEADSQNHSTDFWLFYEANRTYHVTLLQVDPAKGEEALKDLPGSNAWIFGPEFAVFCTRESLGSGLSGTRFRVSVQPIDPDLCLRLRNILSRIRPDANEVVTDGRIVQCQKPSYENGRVHEENMLWGLPRD
jgi:hypothetical protein